MKSKNISFYNYNSIYKNYFEFDILNLIKKGKEKDMNKILEVPLNYEITNYASNTDVTNTASVTLEGAGKYDGTINATFKIIPATTAKNTSPVPERSLPSFLAVTKFI